MSYENSIAFLGPAGTYCNEAALRFAARLGIDDPDLVECASFDEVFDCVDDGTVRFGVVGKENSLEGPVTATLDNFAFRTDSVILAEEAGVSSDFRDLEAAYNEGNPRAIDACEVFAYRVAKYIGAYVAAMNGVDAIAFTAGIGENTSFIREKIVSYLGYLGIKLDKKTNDVRGVEEIISTPDSKVTVCVIPTNEELAICRETVALVK